VRNSIECWRALTRRAAARPNLSASSEEAGIGKSRLVKVVRRPRSATRIRFRSVAVRWATCSPLGEQSFGAVGAVVRSAAGMMQNDNADEMRGSSAALLTDLGLQGEEAKRLMPLLYHVLALATPMPPCSMSSPSNCGGRFSTQSAQSSNGGLRCRRC